MNQQAYPIPVDNIAVKEFITKVFGWMAFALSVTAIVAMYVASSPSLVETFIYNRIAFFVLIFAELGLVIYLTARIEKMSSTQASAVFIGYSILNGLTLSVIFVIYTSESIASTFFVTSATFGVMAAYGYFTKKDLTTIGNIAFMGLIGIIIASVVNWFLKSEMLYWIVTYIGILIFVGLTAYDTQKIKKIGESVTADSETGKKSAILGALRLYLDFVNLMLLLLRVMGRRK